MTSLYNMTGYTTLNTPALNQLRPVLERVYTKNLPLRRLSASRLQFLTVNCDILFIKLQYTLYQSFDISSVANSCRQTLSVRDFLYINPFNNHYLLQIFSWQRKETIFQKKSQIPSLHWHFFTVVRSREFHLGSVILGFFSKAAPLLPPYLYYWQGTSTGAILLYYCYWCVGSITCLVFVAAARPAS